MPSQIQTIKVYRIMCAEITYIRRVTFFVRCAIMIHGEQTEPFLFLTWWSLCMIDPSRNEIVLKKPVPPDLPRQIWAPVQTSGGSDSDTIPEISGF